MGEAAKWFRSAADAGQPQAAVNLGFCYAYGEGVPKDMTRCARIQNSKGGSSANRGLYFSWTAYCASMACRTAYSDVKVCESVVHPAPTVRATTGCRRASDDLHPLNPCQDWVFHHPGPPRSLQELGGQP
jgi:hypothetical protein